MHRKRRGSSKSVSHDQRGRGTILYGAVREREMDSKFSDPLEQEDIKFLKVFFRHSLGLWSGEGKVVTPFCGAAWAQVPKK